MVKRRNFKCVYVRRRERLTGNTCNIYMKEAGREERERERERRERKEEEKGRVPQAHCEWAKKLP